MVFLLFLGGFFFFWLVGTILYKDVAAGIIVPIGVIILSLIGLFLTVVYNIIQ